jgi:hypothetical protein
MGRKRDDDGDEVVVAPAPVGPLGPWRFSLSVVAAAALTGMPLLDAVETGVGLDMALLRTFGAAFLVWIATGMINKMLATAMIDDEPSAAAVEMPQTGSMIEVSGSDTDTTVNAD